MDIFVFLTLGFLVMTDRNYYEQLIFCAQVKLLYKYLDIHPRFIWLNIFWTEAFFPPSKYATHPPHEENIY